MNKLKVAIQELKDHLGRDSQGVLLLDQVTTVANGQRTRCTSLATAVEEAKAREDGLRERIAALEKQEAAHKEEMQQENAKRRAAEAREKYLAQQLATVQPPEDYDGELRAMPGDTLRRNIERLIKRVVKRWKRLPGGRTSGPEELLVEDYVKTFSYDEFAGLGMVAGLCAYFGYPMTVAAEKLVESDPEWDEEYMSQFIFLLGDKNRISKLEKQILSQSEPYGGPKRGPNKGKLPRADGSL